jgi:hypothetical protein
VARLRLFADAHGLTPEQRRGMVRAVPATHTWGYDIVREGADGGHDGYADHWEGARERFDRATVWLERNLDALVQAVS